MSAYDLLVSSSLMRWDLLDDENNFIKPWELEEEPEEAPPPWFWRFRIDQYDWDDPEFVKNNTGPFAYRVIPLSQGYFMIVSPHDYKRMTRFPDGAPKRWCANIQKDPQTGEITAIYARRRGRRGEPTYIYAHRELIGCLEDNGIVDHLNGWGLDNRRGTRQHPVNLRYTSNRENGHNAVRLRSVNRTLPRGVELRRKNKQGKQLYGGMYCKRSGKKVRTIRSKRLWLTPGPAARWYGNQMRKINQRRTTWAYNPESVYYPVFPPDPLDNIPF